MSDEAAALAIQCVGEFAVGLRLLDTELRHGQFTEARQLVADLRSVVQVLDRMIPEMAVCQTCAKATP